MQDTHDAVSYPFGDALPEPSQIMEVAPGVFWARLPLPFALDHINVWLLRDEVEGKPGWMIVDCGVNREVVKEQWEKLFATQLQGLPVLRVLVTHMHPDHVGLAGWLCERWNAPLYMSMTDYTIACLWSQRRNDAKAAQKSGENAAAHFGRNGLSDPESQQKIKERAGYYPGLVSDMPSSFHRLMAGHSITIGANRWEIIVGYGHAPEHVSLYSPALNVLISGDMMLPRISTNVSVFDHEPEANPLPCFVQSLADYNVLPKDVLILPSHGKVFRGLHGRIADLTQHHKDRLVDTLEACGSTGLSAAELVPVLFKRELDLHQLTFAMGEALAHLHALWFEGKLRREKRDDGIYYFVCS